MCCEPFTSVWARFSNGHRQTKNSHRWPFDKYCKYLSNSLKHGKIDIPCSWKLPVQWVSQNCLGILKWNSVAQIKYFSKERLLPKSWRPDTKNNGLYKLLRGAVFEARMYMENNDNSKPGSQMFCFHLYCFQWRYYFTDNSFNTEFIYFIA